MKHGFILSKENVKDKKHYDIIANDSNIYNIVHEAIKKHGPNVDLNNIDVSQVTYMGSLFSVTGFAGDVSQWDVSNVTNMFCMFDGCAKFNGYLNDWNVKNVKNMACMFINCRNFNSPLNNWEVSSVEDMNKMFLGCHMFDQDLTGWNVKNVKNMGSMFAKCIKFKGKGVGSWNMKNVENIEYMFRFCSEFEEDLCNWDLSSCKNMNDYLYGTKVSNYNKPFVKI